MRALNQTQDPPHPPSINKVLLQPPPHLQALEAQWKPDPTTKFGPLLHQLPNGLWFERTFLPSPEILDIVQSAQGAALGTVFSGDGLENHRLPPTAAVYHLFNQNQLGAQQMQGSHTLLFFPKPLPFTDSPHVFSLRAWSNLVRDTLSNTPSSTPTYVSVILSARQNSPTPSVVPILDRRYELDTLRRFLQKILVLPDVPWDERTPAGEVMHSRTHRTMPLLLFCYSNSNTLPVSIRPQVLWMPSPEPLLIPPADCYAAHILINVNLAHALPDPSGPQPSAIRIIMLLNQFDPTETTTQFRESSACLRYPADPLPLIQKSTPEGIAIAHYHVPSRNLALT